MSTQDDRIFTVEDLPRFSSWPARLLGLEEWRPSRKTPTEVTREFDRDKWGALLARYRAAGVGVEFEEVERWALEGLEPSLCSIGERLELLAPHEALARHYEVVAGALQALLPASAIVELGAGYGSITLKLAGDPRFAGVSLYAGEYTGSGVELLRQLAAAARLRLPVARCDLGADQICELAIPENAIIFTCMAAHYIPWLEDRFVAALSRLRPRAIVNFEPCYEHCEPRTLTGALRRRYIEVNDYNRNLITLLHQHAARGSIRMLREDPAVIGVNPLLPISVVEWTTCS